MKTCHIVGGGNFSPELITKGEDDIIIAADAGYKSLTEAGITPDVTIGDFDSFVGDIPSDAIILPTHKDDTDISAAIHEGDLRGYKNFCLYGALGGSRFSHSIANLSLLNHISTRGGSGRIIDKMCEITLFEAGEHTVSVDSFHKISLFPVGDAAEVSLEGFAYPLSHYTFTCNFPLGVSNEISEERGVIKVHRGKVFCIFDD